MEHRSDVFFFNDTATTEIYTLSLHDALPISSPRPANPSSDARCGRRRGQRPSWGDRKSTRLNSSHGYISYAVFCLKKKKMQVVQFDNGDMHVDGLQPPSDARDELVSVTEKVI